MRLVITIVAAAVLLAATSVGASAQRKKGKPRVIQLEEIVIEGRVQKPNAFYILQRSSIGYELVEMENSFVDRIVKSVEQEPF